MLQSGRKIKLSRFVQNTAWILSGQIANFTLQAAYFIFLAHLLTVREYGIFSGSFALLSTLMPYSALGANMLFMKYVAIDRDQAPAYWGNLLVVTACISTLIVLLMICFGPAITGIKDRPMLVTLAIATCFFGQITLSAGSIFQTCGQFKISAAARFSASLTRLLVLAFVFALFHKATARQWSTWILVATAVSSLFAVYQVRKEIPRPRFDLDLLKRRWREGFGFAFAGSTQYAYNDLDKTMLIHYGFSVQSGFYSLAYKVIDFATVPIGSIDAVALPRYFSMADRSLDEATRLLRRILTTNILVGAVIAVAVFALSPVLPLLVGAGYTPAILAMKALSLIPLLRGVHTAIGSLLTGVGFQRQRTVAQVSAAFFNFAANVWAIPHLGWKGAAYTSVATDAFLAFSCAVLFYWARGARATMSSSYSLIDETSASLAAYEGFETLPQEDHELQDSNRAGSPNDAPECKRRP